MSIYLKKKKPKPKEFYELLDCLWPSSSFYKGIKELLNY